MTLSHPLAPTQSPSHYRLRVAVTPPVLRIIEKFPGTIDLLIREGLISPEGKMANSLFTELELGNPDDRAMLDVCVMLGQIEIID